MLASTTQLQRRRPGAGRTCRRVHAVTDVTGFGLLGHPLEMCRGSGLQAALQLGGRAAAARRRSAGARPASRTGAAPRATGPATARRCALPAGLPAWQRGLLCDPQTSGGLLVAVAADAADACARDDPGGRVRRAAIIGRLQPGPAGVVVEA